MEPWEFKQMTKDTHDYLDRTSDPLLCMAAGVTYLFNLITTLQHDDTVTRDTITRHALGVRDKLYIKLAPIMNQEED